MRSHKIEMGYQVTHFDKDGKIKYDKIVFPDDKSDYFVRVKSEQQDIKFPMKSFSRNFVNSVHLGLLKGQANVNSGDFYTTASSTFNGGGAPTQIRIVGAGIAQGNGFLVGTGSLSGSMTNYNLSYTIKQGSGAYQFSYQDTIFTPTYVSGSTYEFNIMRTMINNSSTDVTVREVMTVGESSTFGGFLLTYDTINISGSAINILVPTGSTLAVWNYFSLGSGSFLNKNFLDCLYSHMANTSVTLTPTSGSSYSANFATRNYWGVAASLGQSYSGIVVGSGSAAVNITGSKLDAQVFHGTGSNQIYYLSTDTVTGTPYLIGTSSMEHFVQRVFVNLNTASISLTESAMYIRGNLQQYTQDDRKIMIARVSFDTPLTVEYQEAVNVRYIFKYFA